MKRKSNGLYFNRYSNVPGTDRKTMFEQVLKAIRQFGNFSEEELIFFTSKLKIKMVPKNVFLLKEGQVCRAIYFLNKGSLRHYFTTKDYAERTLNLLTENDWVLDYQSFTSQQPSKNFIRAFEESEIFELDVYSLHELIGQSQSFFKIGKLLERGLPDINLYSNLASPEDKYLNILTNKPAVIKTFPLKYIASYLGMTPETLSRIRRKINRAQN